MFCRQPMVQAGSEPDSGNSAGSAPGTDHEDGADCGHTVLAVADTGSTSRVGQGAGSGAGSGRGKGGASWLTHWTRFNPFDEGIAANVAIYLVIAWSGYTVNMIQH